MKARRLAWVIWGLTLALVGIWPFLGHSSGGLRDELVFYLVVPIAVMAYATVGVLITSRHPGNLIGLILVTAGFSFAVALTAGDYATISVAQADPLPLDVWVAWLARVASAVWLAPIPLLFLLYPDGRVPTRRWRYVLWVALAALSLNLVLFALTPGPLTSFASELGGELINPLGLPLAWQTPVEKVTELAGLIAFGCAVLAVISLVLRFRRSTGVERQQIRWLGYVGSILVAVPVLGLSAALVRQLLGFDVDAEGDVLGIAMWIAFFVVLLFGIPIACAIAILRYRLFDLDVVIKKTILFGILVLSIMAVAIGTFLATSSVITEIAPDETLAVGLVGLTLGVLVWPLYRLSRRIADRLVFGGRSTPYEVLSTFTHRIGGTYSAEDVLPRMAQLLGSATRARAARVWLRVGRQLHPSATWPDDAPAREPLPIEGDRLPHLPGDGSFEVRDGGELLGALSVEMAASDPMDPSKEKLARDLASQAGLVLRNVRLIEELRGSSRRIVAAQDARAKKLERDIHDGAQQQLVALAVKQRVAASLVGKDDARLRALLEELQSATNEALEDLRDLARGIYPPLLADQGLDAALRGQARKASIPVEVDTVGIGRYPPETESAVYFSCLEALQNVAKYARASGATVRLVHADGTLTFEVEDDGVGFDPAGAPHGTGLQGIADRLAALGGELAIRSAPGDGTTVAGRLPIAEAAP